MSRKYVYVVGALTGLCLLLIIFFFVDNKMEQQAVAQNVQVESPPFLTYVSGTGTVEPASGNIIIASPLNRVVEKVNVKVNQSVKKGDILFQLEAQDLNANLTIRQKRYEESVANLNKLKAAPREEDLIIAQETYNKNQAQFNMSALEYCINRRRARSNDEKCMLLYKYNQAESDIIIAQAEYDKVRGGVWSPELKVAQEGVAIAKADIEAAEAEVARSYIKSPIDGTVLQIKVRPGEIADPAKIAMIVGNISELNLRVGIDQFNATRFRPQCKAVAFKQGDLKTEIPLKFIHVEPYMIPKKYLTNELTEKVDTLIFEVLYRIEKKDAHLLIGEQMDVYIYVEKQDEPNAK